ncbi:hypothetical protein BC829DRAFT_212629 [Chytridium lagenaria]|nr:hypothetical protein BC829DRAFT_212629 [Chytridium lagenaria]
MSNYRDFNRPGSSAEAFEYDSGPRRPDYGEVMGGAPVDQISEDNKHIQKYFSIFKKTPKYEYDERQRHAVVASLEMPLPPTGTAIAIGSLRIEAHGKNKKEARAALIRKLKTKVDSEGLMDVAVRYSASFKKGKRNGPEPMDFGGDSRKFGGRAFNTI